MQDNKQLTTGSMPGPSPAGTSAGANPVSINTGVFRGNGTAPVTLAERVQAIPYWYHRIELPGGIVTPGWAPLNAERYAIPADLTGKRILDIGAWDGYWTWEALKRGAAEVVAIDDFSDDCGAPDKVKRNGWETFDICREALGFTYELTKHTPWGDDFCWHNGNGQSVKRLEMSVYDLACTDDTDWSFDVVFFFGTFYHLKHPLLALEKIAAVCYGSIYIESAVCDDYSPYRGGLNRGFSHHEMVMEFYPDRQYSHNPSNWWIPTVECLCAMIDSVGFQDVSGWALTDAPQSKSECRGFASGTKDPAKEPACRPPDVELPDRNQVIRPAKVMAVMSVPRLGFHDNMTSVFECFSGLKVPLWKVQGAYWGQCLERGMQRAIDHGADLIITVDYDTIFKRADVEALLRLANEHPEAAAIVPIQMKRQNGRPLMTMRGRSGQIRTDVSLGEFRPDVTRIATGHFGLTVLRISHLLDVPHPWFWGQPNAEGMWHEGRTDDDIWFWRQMEKHGKIALLANRVVVGHLELMATWPDEQGRALYQLPEHFHGGGKPPEAWK